MFILTYKIFIKELINIFLIESYILIPMVEFGIRYPIQLLKCWEDYRYTHYYHITTAQLSSVTEAYLPKLNWNGYRFCRAVNM